MSGLFGQPTDRDALRRLAGRAEQAIGAELAERLEGQERGVRVLRLRSGELEADVVVERALDLGQVTSRGVPVAWISPTGLAGPWFAEPHGWGPFRTFFGGMLTTCGLEHTLGPTEDDASHFAYPHIATHAYPLHGRLSTQPARLMGHGIDWDAEEPAVYCRGEVRQANVFGEVLTLERELRIPLGSSTIRIRDRVRNDGHATTPTMSLYHVNLGWPLLGPRARVVAAVGEPRFATPEAVGKDWRSVTTPQGVVPEEVWEHTPRTGADGWSRAGIVNDDIGDGRAVAVELAWRTDTLPRLFQWKVMGDVNYVIGLEPGNLPLEGRHAARASGDLVQLAPGEVRDYALEITVHHGADALADVERRIAAT